MEFKGGNFFETQCSTSFIRISNARTPLSLLLPCWGARFIQRYSMHQWPDNFNDGWYFTGEDVCVTPASFGLFRADRRREWDAVREQRGLTNDKRRKCECLTFLSDRRDSRSLHALTQTDSTIQVHLPFFVLWIGLLESQHVTIDQSIKIRFPSNNREFQCNEFYSTWKATRKALRSFKLNKKTKTKQHK